ncbi:MAG: GTPase-associated system all-helical protein GASH [Truepera sp.]|nr:GTPase-associated system all-helical protein GASH [Truepera sp.]
MNDDVLLKFLSKGLINVGGDDDKLEHLRQTAADLAGILEETPAKVCPFALVAFDPHIPPTDPTVVEVEDALRKRWQTYVNTFARTPITVFRAMLLDALINACGRNDTVAAAFVASARNVLPFMEVGDEQEIWADIVADIEKKVAERSEREWATPASISVPDIKFESVSEAQVRIVSKKVSASSLKPKFEAAVGPHSNDPDGSQRDTEGNPHWPQPHSPDWVREFGTRTAEAVGEAINRAIGGLSVESLDLPGYTEGIAGAISDHLTRTLQAVSSAAAGLQRRTNLLWWKEALFSPSALMSYCDMTSFDAAALMAFDMHQQIPTFSPASVTAFLRETVVALPTLDQDETASIRELIKKTRDTDLLSPLRTEAGNLVSAPSGRCSVLAMIGHSDAMHQLDDRGFRDRIGVTPDLELTLPDWSVWIFRELQAARAVAEASAPKPRTARKRAPRK